MNSLALIAELCSLEISRDLLNRISDMMVTRHVESISLHELLSSLVEISKEQMFLQRPNPEDKNDYRQSQELDKKQVSSCVHPNKHLSNPTVQDNISCSSDSSDLTDENERLTCFKTKVKVENIQTNNQNEINNESEMTSMDSNKSSVSVPPSPRSTAIPRIESLSDPDPTIYPRKRVLSESDEFADSSNMKRMSPDPFSSSRAISYPDNDLSSSSMPFPSISSVNSPFDAFSHLIPGNQSNGLSPWSAAGNMSMFMNLNMPMSNSAVGGTNPAMGMANPVFIPGSTMASGPTVSVSTGPLHPTSSTIIHNGAIISSNGSMMNPLLPNGSMMNHHLMSNGSINMMNPVMLAANGANMGLGLGLGMGMGLGLQGINSSINSNNINSGSSNNNMSMSMNMPIPLSLSQPSYMAMGPPTAQHMGQHVMGHLGGGGSHHNHMVHPNPLPYSCYTSTSSDNNNWMMHHNKSDHNNNNNHNNRKQQRDDDSHDLIYNRQGKWTFEEERYADALMQAFERGCLHDCKNNMTLRSYLTLKLQCKPMRISKKLHGKYKGKNMYVHRMEDGAPFDSRLCQMEREFQHSLLLGGLGGSGGGSSGGEDININPYSNRNGADSNVPDINLNYIQNRNHHYIDNNDDNDDIDIDNPVPTLLSLSYIRAENNDINISNNSSNTSNMYGENDRIEEQGEDNDSENNVQNVNNNNHNSKYNSHSNRKHNSNSSNNSNYNNNKDEHDDQEDEEEDSDNDNNVQNDDEEEDVQHSPWESLYIAGGLVERDNGSTNNNNNNNNNSSSTSSAIRSVISKKRQRQ